MASTACQTTDLTNTHEVGTTSNGAFVWRGFDHRWRYNHRLKRMGDFLTQATCSGRESGALPKLACTGSVHHTGAAGTGSDQLSFVSYYTETGSRAASFHSARATLSLEGSERSEIRRTETVDVPVDAEGDVTVLLNGYDLRTAGRAKAKKIKRFRVRIADEPTRHPDAGTVAVDVEGLIDVNCGSAECLLQSNRVHYRLAVEVLVVESPQMHTNTRGFETSYRWNRRDELRYDDVALNRQRQSISGRPEAYPIGLLGFRGVDFDLALDDGYRDHWFVRWQQSIGEVDYHRRSGRASFDLSLFFKEWNARTKSQLLSLARPGGVRLRADVSLVQLPSGGIRQRRRSGTLDWVGRTPTSDVPAAMSWKNLRFRF